MQRSLRSLLSVDAADITGLISGRLISGKVKYYVGKLSVNSSVHKAFRKLGQILYFFPQNLTFLPLFP